MIGIVMSTTESEVRKNLERFGEISVCQFYKGWFKDTFKKAINHPVRLVYIDCDLVDGTKEVLSGCLPALARDGVIFSQDFHINVVRNMLLDEATWKDCPRGKPEIRYLTGGLAILKFNS